VLALNTKSEKAYWRAAKALWASDEHFDAIDCCNRGLEVNPKSRDFHDLRRLISKSYESTENGKRDRAEYDEEKRRDKETELALERAYQLRGLKIRNEREPPDGTPSPQFLVHSTGYKDENDIPLIGPQASTWQAPDPRSLLVFPVLLYYEVHDDTDRISNFREDIPIWVYLAANLPGPGSRNPRKTWDVTGEWHTGNLTVYTETQKQRIIKVSRNMTLRNVMEKAAECEKGAEKGTEQDGLELIMNQLSFSVFVKGSTAEREYIAAVIKRHQRYPERKRREKELELALERAYQIRGLRIDNSESALERIYQIRNSKPHKPPETSTETPKPHFITRTVTDCKDGNPLIGPKASWQAPEPEPVLLVSVDDIPLTGPEASTWQAPDPESLLHFPIFLRYMEPNIRDTFPSFPEHHSIGRLLDQQFPGPGSSNPRKPWDDNGDWSTPNLTIYAKTHQMRIHKLDRNMTLRQIIDRCAENEEGAEEGTERDGLVLVKEGLGLFVFVEGSTAEKDWIAGIEEEAAAV